MNEEISAQHGVMHEYSNRTVGMDPTLASAVIREEEDLKYPLLPSSLIPPVVDIHVASESHATLVNGLGANWSPPGQGEEAFPEDNDEAGWEQIFGGMDRSGIRWVRYWLQPMDLCADGSLDKNHRFLQKLDRLNEWARRTTSTIMLELSSIPEAFRTSEVYDAPSDNETYVCQYIIPLIRHIVNERGVDRIRQLSLFNEPFNADVAPPIFAPPPPQDPLTCYLELHECLRAAMDESGDAVASIRLIGPDSANMFQRHIEMYEDKGLSERVQATFGELDCHIWRMRFDYYPPSKRWPGYIMSEGIERYLRPTLAASKKMGKLLSLTEAGTMYFNEDPCTARVTAHDAFLVMAEQIVRAVNEGIAGALIWSYTSSGRIDGQWGWLKTRAEKFSEVPNLLNGFTALMRHHRPGAAIHYCTVNPADFSGFISAGVIAMDEQDGADHTIWLINDHPVERIRVRLRLPENWIEDGATLNLLRKGFAQELQESKLVVTDNNTVDILLPGMTLTTLTTFQ